MGPDTPNSMRLIGSFHRFASFTFSVASADGGPFVCLRYPYAHRLFFYDDVSMP